MDQTQNSICKMIVRGVIKAGTCLGLTSALGPAGPVAEKIIEETSAEVLDGVFEKLDAITPKKKADFKTACRNILPTGTEQYEPILATAAELCMENLDFFQDSFSAEEKSAELSTAYLARYQNQFDQAELDVLARLLPAVLSQTISDLQTELVFDPDFRRQLDTYLMDTAEQHTEEIEKLRRQQEHTAQDVDELKSKVSHPAVSDLDVADEYRDAWTDTMFLHDNLPLCEVYQLPYYQFPYNSYSNSDLHKYLQTFLDSSNDRKNRMLVILGQPGSGKSTLITYLLNNCIIDRPVRVFQFRNLGIADWNSNFETLPAQILQHVGLIRQDLNNSVLILDGLDEVNMTQRHCEFLNAMFKKWANSSQINNFSLFITCRQNRISNDDLDELSPLCVNLCPLSESQIKEFSTKYYSYTQEEKHVQFDFRNSNISNVLGIPIILYMILSLNIEVGSSTSMVEIYEKIFSPDEKDKKTSIYYRSHDTEHPVTAGIASYIHEFSKQISIKIWEFHPDEAYIDAETCRLLSEQITADSNTELQDLLIGQYFIEGQKSHTLYFVHRSIYEYFVARSLFDAILPLYTNDKSPDQLFKDIENPSLENPLIHFANLIGIQNLSNHLQIEIKNYLIHMLQCSNICPPESWWSEFLESFLLYGLSDFSTNRHTGGIQGIKEEILRFSNIFFLSTKYIKLFKNSSLSIKSKSSFEALAYYSKITDIYLNLSSLDLSHVILNGAHLEGAHLEGMHLEGAQLKDAHLEGAHLEGIHFDGAHLEGAHLEQAHLNRAYLIDAHLIDAHLELSNLTDTHLYGASLKGARLGGAYLHHTDFQKSDLHNANLNGILYYQLERSNLPRGFKLPRYYEIDRSGIVRISVISNNSL